MSVLNCFSGGSGESFPDVSVVVVAVAIAPSFGGAADGLRCSLTDLTRSCNAVRGPSRGMPRCTSAAPASADDVDAERTAMKEGERGRKSCINRRNPRGLFFSSLRLVMVHVPTHCPSAAEPPPRGLRTSNNLLFNMRQPREPPFSHS